MTFIPDEEIEAAAAELWRTHGLAPGFDVEEFLDELDLGLVWEEVDEPADGVVLGQLVPSRRQVVLNEHHLRQLEARGGRLLRFTIAHEIGHWQLHAEDIRAGAQGLFDGERVWCRSGSRAQPEVQAERFAAALLIPIDRLSPALPATLWYGWAPIYELADGFLVSPTAMRIRLERLGVVHLNEDGYPCPGPSEVSDDPEFPF